jgi:hypothetical protein
MTTMLFLMVERQKSNAPPGAAGELVAGNAPPLTIRKPAPR